MFPDVRARLYMHKLGERWGVPVIVDNRPGASGNIGFGLAPRPVAWSTPAFCRRSH